MPQFDWLCGAANGDYEAKYADYVKYKDFFADKDLSTAFTSAQAFEPQVLGGAITEKMDLVKLINPETYIDKDDPAYFIRSGTADMNVPFLQAVDFAAELTKSGVKNDFKVVEGANHGIPGSNFFDKFNIEDAYTWLDGIL
jgi:dipeptidyl aminopeptidase/acylaminoacyl peptidase